MSISTLKGKLEIGFGRRRLEVTHDSGAPNQFVFVTHDIDSGEGVVRTLDVKETRRLIRWLEQRLPQKKDKTK
jgi:hypothetical protein